MCVRKIEEKELQDLCSQIQEYYQNDRLTYRKRRLGSPAGMVDNVSHFQSYNVFGVERFVSAIRS